jgi:hypothetical protein
MKLSAVFSVQAVLAALFGLWFLLAPGAIMEVYGIQPDLSNVFFARLLGAAYIGIAMISWGARHSSFETRPLLVPAFATANSLGVVVTVYQGFLGQGNQLRWLNAVIFLALAAGFVYHTFSPRFAR